MLTFELVTLEGVKFTEECYSVALPTPGGVITVMPHHIPLVSVAMPGVVSVRRNQNDPDSKLEHFASDGGVIEISGTRVRLLANAAEAAGDINEMEAKEALERARELQLNAKDQVALADATGLIERHLAQLKVAELKRRHKRT